MTSFTLRLFALLLILFGGFQSIFAQELNAVVVRGNGLSTNPTDEDDSVVTGATVRGRVVYEDTNRPVRYALISLVSSKDSNLRYSEKFVKTDENGEFVIKNVKAGTYTPFVKSEGVLNQDSFNFTFRQPNSEDKTPEIYEKVEVAGLGEIQIFVRAKRGGSISGRIFYADGEVAVGVRVEVLQKVGETYSNSGLVYGNESAVGTADTDDRGFYRLAGLPEGKYLVRVIEPISHSQVSQYSYAYRNPQQSRLLKTYYPEGENSKKARELEVFLGQEQSGIDITLPERQLFNVSGKIISKQTGQPLDNFTVSFFKVEERDELVVSFDGLSASTNSNKAGDWNLKSLPKGKYRITVRQGDVYRRPDEKKDEPEISYPQMVKETEITDKDLANINFELPIESSVSGTIIVEGGKDVPPDIMVFAVGEENRQIFNYNANRQNNPQPMKQKAFRIGKMIEGKYRLLIPNQSFYVKSATLGGKDLLNSDFELKEGEELKGVQIVIATDMGTVKGNVSGYDGKEQAIVVLAKPNATFGQLNWSSYSARIKPNGDFEAKAAPGEYAIFVFSRKNMPKTEAEAWKWVQNLIRNAQTINVSVNQTINVSLSMPN